MSANPLNPGTPEHINNSFAPLPITDEDFQRVMTFIKKNYGIDLSKKRQLITGRLSPTIRKMGYTSFTQFVDHLLKEKNDAEITMLLNKLTTNYTFFMREEEHLNFFRQRIIPDIVRRHQRDKCLSIWSAGCSSGEEPYNISMYLFDYLGSQAAQWDTRILATDISAQALNTAKAGTYELPNTVPPEWRRKYFTPNPNGTYTVSRQIRENVIFRPFNLMDPINFRRKFDVIFCRNVMIYFDQPTKDALVRRFYDATVPSGYLLISYSENLSQQSPYRRVATATFQK